MRLLMLAPPGAGKGTQAARLAQRFNIEHIASGDLLRQEVNKGTELGRVTLTSDAARRLDIQMEPVVANGGGEGTRIPYGAVLYDPEGNTWAFVNVNALTFLRAPINVDHIDGDVAFLSDGPPVGTQVVKVGAAELYGAEIGVGDE